MTGRTPLQRRPATSQDGVVGRAPADVSPVAAAGLTYYQIAAVLVVAYYLARGAAGTLGRSLE